MRFFLSVSIILSLYSMAHAMEGKEKVRSGNIFLVSTPVLYVDDDSLEISRIFGLKLGPDDRLVEAVVFDDKIKDWCRSKKFKNFPRYFPLIVFKEKKEGDVLYLRINGELMLLTINHSHARYSKQRSFDSVMYRAWRTLSPQTVVA